MVEAVEDPYYQAGSAPSSSTIGNSTWDRPTVRWVELVVNPPANSGISDRRNEDEQRRHRARAQTTITKSSVDASWKASTRLLLLEQLREHGHERRAEAPSRRTGCARGSGTWNAIVKAENAPLVAKY